MRITTPAAAHRGFTIVELLVIISIIAILVVILLPALSKARGAALTVQCGTNTRQFLIANFNYVTDTQVLAPHQQSNLNLDGMLMPFWFDFVAGSSYLSDVTILLCPTANLTDYPWKYKASTNALDRDDVSWKTFYKPTRSPQFPRPSDITKLDKPSYNQPMGTYYYWGGAAYRTSDRNGEWWKSHQDGSPPGQWFTMQDYHVGKPSEWAIIWDQDRWRNYLSHGNLAALPHEAYTPGRTFGYFDGHARFIRLLHGQPYVTHNDDDASNYTPYFHESVVRYRGANYSSSAGTYENGIVANILNLPTR